MFTKIIFWILLNYGFVNIVVFGLIFENFREFFKKWGDSNNKFNWFGRFIYEMITCPMCFGTWSGFIMSFLVYSPTHNLFQTPIFYSWFLDGLLASGGVWVINSIIEFFEENRFNK